MNTVLKYLGVILVLVGVVCLVVYKFATPLNGLLVAALALMVLGMVAHVFLNKKF